MAEEKPSAEDIAGGGEESIAGAQIEVAADEPTEEELALIDVVEEGTQPAPQVETRQAQPRDDRPREKPRQNDQDNRRKASRRDLEIAGLRRKQAEQDEIIRLLLADRQNGAVRNVDRDISQMEALIAQENERLESAVSTGDGKAAREANERLSNLRMNLAGAKTYKAQMSAPRAPAPQPAPAALAWFSANEWFDSRGGDDESRAVLKISDELLREGMDDRSPAFWAEIDKRRGLAEEEDERPAPRQPQRQSARQQMGGGTPQATPSGRVQISLSPERVQAIKDMGEWDDPKRRAYWAKKFSSYDRANPQR